MTDNKIGTQVIEAAIAVDLELGPGLLETVYEVVLARELSESGLKVVRQAPVHKKQVQTYLKLTGCKRGYLLNFGEEGMRASITRCVNDLDEQPLRHCASAGVKQVPTTGGYLTSAAFRAVYKRNRP